MHLSPGTYAEATEAGYSLFTGYAYMLMKCDDPTLPLSFLLEVVVMLHLAGPALFT